MIVNDVQQIRRSNIRLDSIESRAEDDEKESLPQQKRLGLLKDYTSRRMGMKIVGVA